MTSAPVLVVFGTRPEAIKLAPIPVALKAAGFPEVRLCSTGQHREMLRPVLDLFGLTPDYDLDLMQANQSLPDLTARCLVGIAEVVAKVRPSVVMVQGDTTTALAAGWASFYARVPVAHVEAGLRTGDKYSPFPEEMNRVVVSELADFHFAPTEHARSNLLAEGKNANRIWVTGNTGIDALHLIAKKIGALECPPGLDDAFAARVEGWGRQRRRMILVTGHRRESFGEGFQNIAVALREIAARNPDVEIVYPVHLNPNVRQPVHGILGSQERVHLLSPLPYGAFAWLMRRAHLILTDSGGIQEEAPGLGKPVLVMREITERPEAIEAGTSKLVGTSPTRIINETELLLRNPEAYERMARAQNPFGDGRAAERIAQLLVSEVLEVQR